MNATQRPWVKYLVRTLLLLALVENLGLCWLVVKMQAAGHRREAVQHLKNWHWPLLHDYLHNSDYDLVSSEPRGSTGLVTLLGVDFFNDVTWLGTQRPEYGKPQDADFDYLLLFPHLRRLDLGSDATDRVMERLEHLHDLDWLDVNGGTITNEGLGRLRHLTGLRRLFLNGTQVSSSGIAQLRGLTSLQTLDLEDTAIDDSALENLKDMKQLRDLTLSGTMVTDLGTKHLTGLTQLRFLNLKRTKVTEQGIRELKAALPDCLVLH